MDFSPVKTRQLGRATKNEKRPERERILQESPPRVWRVDSHKSREKLAVRHAGKVLDEQEAHRPRERNSEVDELSNSERLVLEIL
jgi:hypothetical protein